MAIFTIFWCAFFGVVFWIASMILKSIKSVINSAYDTILDCGLVLIVGIFGLIILFLVYLVSYGIRTGSFFAILLTVVVIGFVIGLFGSLGAAIIEVVAVVATYLISLFVVILDFLNSWVEHAYVFFLNKIKKKVESL